MNFSSLSFVCGLCFSIKFKFSLKLKIKNSWENSQKDLKEKCYFKYKKDLILKAKNQNNIMLSSFKKAIIIALKQTQCTWNAQFGLALHMFNTIIMENSPKSYEPYTCLLILMKMPCNRLNDPRRWKLFMILLLPLISNRIVYESWLKQSIIEK